MLEFENRMRSQSSRSRLPGFYSVRGLLWQLSKLRSEGKSETADHTLLTVAIDFYLGLSQTAGESAAHSLVKLLANSIQQSVGENAISAYADEGVFHIVLPGRKVAAVRVVAEQISQSFHAAQSDRAAADRLSLTTAIVPWQIGVTPEQLLEQGTETLSIAKQSGGDGAIEYNAFAKELASWQNELTVGSPFANVIAQDIMEPFPYVLERNPLNRAMLAALRRSGAPLWPFVNHEGRLVGVATPSPMEVADEWDQNAEESLTLTNPVTIAHNASFPEIYEAFSSQGCLEMVVVADHRPIGYLTFSGFISLIEPINSATFSSAESTEEDSRSLLVGSLVNDSEPASDSDP